jgi:predicted NUDIX family NTP pyrophosphohydrolase
MSISGEDDMARSAGTLLYQLDDGVLKVLIAHMGGPFWARKDERAWSIPKGEYDDAEDPRAAAAREFLEEMGSPLPEGELLDLGTVTQSGGKRITAYALNAGFDTTDVRSNLFEMEWPKGSGRMRSFPEVDRAEWVDCTTARVKLVSAQVAFVDRLLERLGADGIAVREA